MTGEDTTYLLAVRALCADLSGDADWLVVSLDDMNRIAWADDANPDPQHNAEIVIESLTPEFFQD